MIVFRSPAEVPDDFGASVVAIGKFDGVHAGHRAVIERARVDAVTVGAKVVAVTFDRNPQSVLAPKRHAHALIGETQKLRLLADSGVDATLLLSFDDEFAESSPRAFVEEVLVAALHVRTVLVGRDFRFGHGGVGTPETLAALGAELGFYVDIVEDVRAIEESRRVSSTWVRELLAAGDVATAAKLLGRPAGVWGEVVHGLKRGRELGYPTANLSDEYEGFVPADGVYAGWLVDDGVDDGLQAATRYPAAISVGTNPTFDDVESRQVEAYVIDGTGLDLYGHRVEIQFVDRIRGMLAFDGVEPLMAQMGEDVVTARGILGHTDRQGAPQ